MRSLVLLVAAVVVAVFADAASARNGRVTFDGGTPAQQVQVIAALRVSTFDWDVLPTIVTVHLAAGVDSRALPGEVWLDTDLLDGGTLAWGVVQHEFAHQVDFFLFSTARRAELLHTLGGAMWFRGAASARSPDGSVAHGQLGSERFASTFAWSFWSSPSNVMKPRGKRDESAAMAPAAFRALVMKLLAQRAASS